MINKITDVALKNYKALKANDYPGRLIIIGMDVTGKYLLQLYAIMGRSVGSRNRVFIADSETGLLQTKPADMSLQTNALFTIYDAMLENVELGAYAVSNGEQTQDALIFGQTESGLLNSNFKKQWSYENDGAIFTPRISAISLLKDGGIKTQFSIMKKSLYSTSCRVNIFERTEHIPGFGHFLSTYKENGDPPPYFEGEPLLLPLYGEPNQILQDYWEHLDEANRISLAIKIIDIATGISEIKIINKYKQK